MDMRDRLPVVDALSNAGLGVVVIAPTSSKLRAATGRPRKDDGFDAYVLADDPFVHGVQSTVDGVLRRVRQSNIRSNSGSEVRQMESQETTTTVQAGELHALADLLADLTPAALAADHLDQLEALERIKAAAAAAQVAVTTAFADAAVERARPCRPAGGGRRGRCRSAPRSRSRRWPVRTPVSSGCCSPAGCAMTSR